ncbi:ABC transporter ATP-binding protein [Cereibacter azotoformans]|uniref:ABC transporter domain-containing protein n=1 Tax=Cereibacter sphaeroides (strain ATCC 17025 / ATH 2.4.3) TaxID=349102 RepID=A4WXD1_CERS5|nr:ABC transporter ATP-binding protein [Cereibacter azotoformans]ULB11500.1 ABC transporter ATP-binding protein [Cereibacter azotoformans]
MADLVLENLTIKYGEVTAVENLNIHVASGEFLTLLGPSGCGKSTSLFAVAGLNHATSGIIRVGDKVLFDGHPRNTVPPERRNIGLVFQSYALWPHKTVADNLAFPLILRKMGKSQRDERIREALGLVEMLPYADRFPFELSGGQQQRVALARALVYRPPLLLLDEPLSNLDAKLRERARVWLRELQERLNVTTIYVTHDQAEALAVSDRIAVMSMGRMRQLGSPRDIYERPADSFVADFIGSSNFLDGRMIESGTDQARVRLADGTELVTPPGRAGEDGALVVAIRPERIEVVRELGPNGLRASVMQKVYLGSVWQYVVRSGEMEFRIQTTWEIDDPTVTLRFPPEHCAVFAEKFAGA